MNSTIPPVPHIAEAGYSVVRANTEHLPGLPAIELASAQMLKGHAPEHVLAETTPIETFRKAADEGRLWVALTGGEPVGFALVEMLDDDRPHLDELDVRPDHGRRGLGTALVQAVCQWASMRRYPVLTLTTFRDVPWNMPFYARLGFTEIPLARLRRELADVVAAESSRGLDPATRVVMAYSCERPGVTSDQIRLARSEDRDGLLEVWLRSVRATHSFVSEADIESFTPMVRDYLASAGELWVICDGGGAAVGFMGLVGAEVESLFLVPEVQRQGLGRRLIEHARRRQPELTVSVNEQNAGAVRFYESCGFVTVGRSELDGNGRPYPLLHMRTVSRDVDE